VAKYDRKDTLYQRAKEDGYRSRAAYKLIEIDDRYKVLAPDACVLDLGAWPGGWTQVIMNRLGPNGRIVAIDLAEIDSIGDPRLIILHGDARETSHLTQALESIDRKAFSVIVSDMSAKLTGIKEADQMASVACGELALWVAGCVLEPGGTLVMKLFKGGDVEQFVKGARRMFNKLVRAELKSTRQTSNEFYVIGTGFRPAP
jgi:23S rRNA (uridine2552-2'-O)-methyltransferase